jgi:hypothetical protein
MPNGKILIASIWKIEQKKKKEKNTNEAAKGYGVPPYNVQATAWVVGTLVH